MAESTVIIPVFNQARLTQRCLETVLRLDECEVIVVNDGSTDGTATLLAGYRRRIRVLTHRRNRGFAVSCNDGAALARTKHLLFLNNDTVPRLGWLRALEQYSVENPKAAVIGGKLLYPDGTIQHAGVAVCQDGYPRHIYSGFAENHPAVSLSRRFQIVTGACMLVGRRVFHRLGGFDAAFRNGFEDVDFCLRACERGHEVHYCAGSVVVHLESVSPGRFKHDRANVALYRKRWSQRARADDLQYYVHDGLLRFDYEGRYPLNLEVSPRLATLDPQRRNGAVERVLRERSRQIAELTRENTRLRMELGEHAKDSPVLQYDALRERIRAVARRCIPQGATVLVVSRGDSSLLNLGYKGWHFPRTGRGAYAGYHPADSDEAIGHLEELRRKGAAYLLIPETSAWWLEHYAGFRLHLEACCRRRTTRRETCHIFQLAAPK